MRPDGPGRWLMDLPAANRRVIRESGVPDGQILDPAWPPGSGPGCSSATGRPARAAGSPP